MDEPSLQETYAPNCTCFGCGPSNPDGLRIRSLRDGDEVICDWAPAPMHQAFPGMLNGGIVGALIDCHFNWAAAVHLMERRSEETPPCTVTAEYSVQLKRPTPSDQPVHIRAKVIESSDRKAVVEGTVESGGQIVATGRGTFVAVKPDHPAYHRW